MYGRGAVDRIDLGGGRRARLLPFPADAVALSPDGRTLAAFVAQTGDVLLVDTRSQRTRRRTLSAQAMPASIVWARSAQLIVAPYGQRATTLVLDRDLRTRGRIRWGGNAVAVSGGVLYGVGYDGSVVTTPLASGTVRHAGRLPTRVVNAAAGVPRAG